jgi:hypothetical protein
MLGSMVAFDTAKVERALREPLGEEAAREVTAALAEGMTDHIATRDDLGRLGNDLRAGMGQLRTDLRAEMGQLRTDLRAEIAVLRSELSAEIRQAEQRTLIRLGAWTLAVMSAGIALLRLTL